MRIPRVARDDLREVIQQRLVFVAQRGFIKSKMSGSIPADAALHWGNFRAISCQALLHLLRKAANLLLPPLVVGTQFADGRIKICFFYASLASTERSGEGAERNDKKDGDEGA